MLCLGFLPLEPVDNRMGSAGWLVAAWCSRRARRASWHSLSAGPAGARSSCVCYGAVGGVAVLNWLSGSYLSAYSDLFVIWAGTSAVHPPRRSFPVVLTAAAVPWIPFLIDGGGGTVAGRLAAQSLLIIVVGIVLGAILFDIRRQRLIAAVTDKLARQDALTGLGNRRAFDETLAVEIARARREDRPLSIGIADLDDLKGINDSFGHLEGDRCLTEAARAIELSVRITDRCFRWGGDEFVIVLPSSDRAVADEVLQRMADAVADMCEAQDGRPVTLTFGSAEFEQGMTIDEVIALADLSLLGNKPAKRD